jgi:Thioredoxin-like domain
MLRIKTWLRFSIACLLVIICSLGLVNPAWAGVDDDKFDGNVFVLYAGNGSLVPPRISLADSLKMQKPSLIAFYVDDSSDCKKYAGVISQLQAYYGRAASFIPVTVDSLDPTVKYPQTEPGYYYTGSVPQVVVVDGNGKVRLNEKGQVPFEKIDDVLRQVFNLLPRSESAELKQRSFNEFNSELTK